MTEDNRQINKPTEEWVAKLRYSRSFLAKLMMSEPEVKEFYAALATKLLGLEKVRSNLTWNGIRFVAGRKAVAYVTFGGKTLVAYFALDPAAYAAGKYRLTDVSGVKRFAATPGKLRITSARALSFALRLVNDIAKESDLRERAIPIRPISAKDFPSDSFKNLLARGLIRLLKETVKPPKVVINPTVVEVRPSEDGQIDVATTEGTVFVSEEDNGLEDGEDVETNVENAYLDTLATSAALTERHGTYRGILDTIADNPPEVNLTKKRVLSVVDETWIMAIEDCLQALDEVTRNPMHFIEETEELLPIERTKKVTQRSIQHLSQHSGLISRVEGDTIIPSKLLNVFRDDSLMTYENKFVNTLLMRLYDFVSARYESAKAGVDKEVTELELEQKIELEDTTAKVVVHLELMEPKREKGKNRSLQTDLWKRVVRLYETVCDYQTSPFVQQMGAACIRPPVMRTNAILKNKNLSQCLELWEFIEGYEDEKGLTEDEQYLEPDADYLSHLERAVATQYLTFRHNVSEDAAVWAEPKRDEAKYATITSISTIAEAVADGIVKSENEGAAADGEGAKAAGGAGTTYVVVEATEAEPEFEDDDFDDEEFEEEYKAKIDVGFGGGFAGAGATTEEEDEATESEAQWAIRVALAADIALDEVSRARREAEQRKREEEERAALDKVAVSVAPKAPEQTVDDTPVALPEEPKTPDWGEEEPPVSPEDAQEGADDKEEVVRIGADGVPMREVTTYRKSMQAKLQLADETVKKHYAGIYNRLTSKERVKARMSFEYASFTCGGKTLARMTIIGKTLRVYYALDPNELDPKYNVKDASDVKKYAATPALLFVRGSRSYQYALDLVDKVTEGLADAKNPYTVRAEDFPYRNIEALVAAGLVQRTVTSVPVDQGLFGGKGTPLKLKTTKKDADYSEDYKKAARKMMAKEKQQEERVLSLDGIVNPGDVRKVLEQTDAEMEKERLERLAEETKSAAPTMAQGGDGDALVLRKEAMTVSTPDDNAPTFAATVEPEPKPVERKPVPMGGDALTPKPMTVEDIEKLTAGKSEDEAVDNADSGKKSRRLRRKNKKRK